MKGLCGDHRKKTPRYPLTKTESVLYCKYERQARELEQRIRPPVEDWLRWTRNTVYLEQQMVVVYVEQY